MATPRDPNAPPRVKVNVMTASFLTVHDSDEEWDVEVRDSENLDRTLSDIIEGRSPYGTPSKAFPPLEGLGDTAEAGEGTAAMTTTSSSSKLSVDEAATTSSSSKPSVDDRVSSRILMAASADSDGSSVGGDEAENNHQGPPSPSPSPSPSGGVQAGNGSSQGEGRCRDSLEERLRGENDDGGASPLSRPEAAGGSLGTTDCDAASNQQTVSSSAAQSTKSSNGDCPPTQSGEASVILSGGEYGEYGGGGRCETGGGSFEDVVLKESTV
ncbi:hypothetical protein ACOMHN_001578 [Nucella lapillus]